VLLVSNDVSSIAGYFKCKSNGKVKSKLHLESFMKDQRGSRGISQLFV